MAAPAASPGQLGLFSLWQLQRRRDCLGGGEERIPAGGLHPQVVKASRIHQTASTFWWDPRGTCLFEKIMQVIPHYHNVKRETYGLKKIVEYAKNRNFTSLIVHTNRRKPGLTAHFKLSILVLRR
ncbi:unnamed protein product [Urochloa humidicola]